MPIYSILSFGLSVMIFIGIAASLITEAMFPLIPFSIESLKEQAAEKDRTRKNQIIWGVIAVFLSLLAILFIIL